MKPVVFEYTKYPITKDRAQLLPMVPMVIKNLMKIDTLVDTGCTGLILPHSFAGTRGISALGGSSSVQTAGGTIRTAPAMIEELWIPGLGIWRNVEAHIMPPGIDIPAPLLGLETILSEFDAMFSPSGKKLTFFGRQP